MPMLRKVLGFKIVVSLLLWVLPLLFLPEGLFPELGIPTWTPAATIFVRLLGAAYLAILTIEVWSFMAPHERPAGIVTGIISSGGASMILWHYVFYGELYNWEVLGKLVITSWLVLQVVFAVVLTVLAVPLLRGTAAPQAPPATPDPR
jgi:hypothetical protein